MKNYSHLPSDERRGVARERKKKEGREGRRENKLNQIYPHDLFQLPARPSTFKEVLVFFFASGKIVDF